MHHCKNSIKKSKERLITTANNSIDNIRTYRKTIKNKEIEMGRKTTVLDTSSNKLSR